MTHNPDQPAYIAGDQAHPIHVRIYAIEPARASSAPTILICTTPVSQTVAEAAVLINEIIAAHDTTGGTTYLWVHQQRQLASGHQEELFRYLVFVRDKASSQLVPYQAHWTPTNRPWVEQQLGMPLATPAPAAVETSI